jgi:hypothetical protein
VSILLADLPKPLLAYMWDGFVKSAVPDDYPADLVQNFQIAFMSGVLATSGLVTKAFTEGGQPRLNALMIELQAELRAYLKCEDAQ